MAITKVDKITFFYKTCSPHLKCGASIFSIAFFQKCKSIRYAIWPRSVRTTRMLPRKMALHKSRKSSLSNGAPFTASSSRCGAMMQHMSAIASRTASDDAEVPRTIGESLSLSIQRSSNIRLSTERRTRRDFEFFTINYFQNWTSEPLTRAAAGLNDPPQP